MYFFTGYPLHLFTHPLKPQHPLLPSVALVAAYCIILAPWNKRLFIFLMCLVRCETHRRYSNVSLLRRWRNGWWHTQTHFLTMLKGKERLVWHELFCIGSLWSQFFYYIHWSDIYFSWVKVKISRNPFISEKSGKMYPLLQFSNNWASGSASLP